MKSLVIVSAAFAVTLAGCASSGARVVSAAGGPTIAQVQAAPYNGPKQRIAVTAFQFMGGNGDSAIGRGMSDMLTDALFNSGRFIVEEREHLSDVSREQDLAKTGRFRKDTVAPSGQFEGAQLLIRGAVTEWEPNCSGGSMIIVSAKQACLAINLRIIDVRTGRVVNATTVEGTSANSGVGIVFATGALPVGLGAYSKTPMEAAIRTAIDTAVRYIANQKL